MGSGSCMAEFQAGEEFNTTFDQTAAEFRRAIERAQAAGWTPVRILRDYVVIREPERRAIAASEPTPASGNF